MVVLNISSAVPGRQDMNDVYNPSIESMARSPRRSHLRDVGDRTIAIGSPQCAVLLFNTSTHC